MVGEAIFTPPVCVITSHRSSLYVTGAQTYGCCECICSGDLYEAVRCDGYEVHYHRDRPHCTELERPTGLRPRLCQFWHWRHRRHPNCGGVHFGWRLHRDGPVHRCVIHCSLRQCTDTLPRATDRLPTAGSQRLRCWRQHCRRRCGRCVQQLHQQQDGRHLHPDMCH